MIFSKALLKTKLKATGIHLSMSLVIFFILAYQIIYVWYPQPYFSIDGGWQGIRIVAAVDLALGPIITFLIFDLAKSRKELFFEPASHRNHTNRCADIRCGYNLRAKASCGGFVW
ncbi:MAG: hypothetical protein IIC58_08470 [Proteobacteria bacterium]|nr:hypothetical protein [Pseudomonadota bacterium]